jgi:hypothetical protein
MGKSALRKRKVKLNIPSQLKTLSALHNSENILLQEMAITNFRGRINLWYAFHIDLKAEKPSGNGGLAMCAEIWPSGEIANFFRGVHEAVRLG